MSNLSKTVGQTPLIQISERIFAKFEGQNPSGSIKDRMASYIINHAEKNGLIKKGDTIIEATSGNSGIAFAFLAAERGYKCIIIMPANMSEERKQMLRLYGAELIEVPDGKFDDAIALRDKMAKENGYFNPNQFHNPLNIEAHEKGTAVEILHQHTNKIAAFVDGTGTGGTLMGTTRVLKSYHGNMKVVAVEPAESPVMSGGSKGELASALGVNPFFLDEYLGAAKLYSASDVAISAAGIGAQPALTTAAPLGIELGGTGATTALDDLGLTGI